MVFEPNFTRIATGVRKNIGMTQTVIELKLPTNEEVVNKIYSVGARSTITNYEVNGNEIAIIGNVDFQAVYESVGLSTVDYTAEFKDKYVAENNLNGDCVLNSTVIDVTSEVLAGSLKVVAVVEISIDEIENNEMNVLTSVNGEDVCISNTEINYSTYLGRVVEKFDVNDELVVDGATNILMVTPCINVTNVIPRENYIIVDGKINLVIFYQKGNEINDVATINKEIGFDWEVAYNGVNEKSCIQNLFSIVNNEIKITTTMEEGVARMMLNIPVVYSGYVFNNNTLSIINDLYLEKNYLAVTCENYKTISNCASVSFKDNISGTATILETSPFIDEVLGVSTNNIMLASSRIEDNMLCLEGVVNSSVVYYTKETNEVTSVQVEMPFAIEKRIDGREASVVTLCLEGLNARSKRGKEIEVSAELNVFVDAYGESQECVITNVVLGEEKPQEDCVLSVYVVRDNQTIWDIAKDNNVSQELLLEQNPNIELPVKPGDKLVVYKPNTIKF